MKNGDRYTMPTRMPCSYGGFKSVVFLDEKESVKLSRALEFRFHTTFTRVLTWNARHIVNNRVFAAHASHPHSHIAVSVQYHCIIQAGRKP